MFNSRDARQRPETMLARPAVAGLLICLLAGAGLAAAQAPAPDPVTAAFAIKEALLIASERAVQQASAENGFLDNPEISVPLPGDLATAAETLRRFGLAPQVDALELASNRAAEAAAAQALPYLAAAIRDLELGDTQQLLTAGGDAAATLLRERAEPWLAEQLLPTVSSSLEPTGVRAAFQELVANGGNLVSMAGVSSDDLAPHIADATAGGLMQLVAYGAQAIREDPAARTTPLLQQVFGALPPAAAGAVQPAETGQPAAEVVTVAEAGPAAPATGQPAPDERHQALTEALLLGAQRAIGRASQVDGFFANTTIHIPLPKKLQKLGSSLRDFGLGSVVDELELSMNRAAEQAAGEALPIVTDAVKSVRFEDVLAILQGGETAATETLRSKTEVRLTEVLQPIIATKMEATGVSRSYDRLIEKAGPVLMLLGLDTETDLPTYVTGATLDGLFTLIAEEEQKIRKDPVARTTELLRRIFGG